MKPFQQAIFLVAAAALLGSTFFVLGGYGVNGPDTAPNSLNMGLVGYWDMEEGSGQMAYDKSGGGNHATLGAAGGAEASDPVFGDGHDSSGLNGTALEFDGRNTYAEAASATSLDITTGLSISAWVKPAALKEEYIMSKHVSDTVTSGYNLLVTASQFYFRLGDGAAAHQYNCAHGMTAGKWYHVTATWDGTTMLMYRDGVKLSCSTAFSGTLGTNTNKLRLGGRLGDSYYWQGALDEVRLYNRALTQDEINLLYNQKKPILQYKLDEGAGTVAYDASFNAVNGTLGGGTAGYSPAWTAGESGSALSFDGTDDFLQSPDESSLDFTGAITLEAWIKPAVSDGNIIRKVDTNQGYEMYIRSSQRIALGSNEFASELITDNGALTLNAWNHVAGVVDASGNASIYVNGVLVKSGAIQALNTTTTNPLVTGGISWLSGVCYSGLIDEVRIYSYARSADEVLVDYNLGLAAQLGKRGPDPDYGLVGYWDMEEATGQAIHDKSPNHNDGTLGYGSTVEASDPVFGPGHDASGANGTGLVLDGGDDLAEIDTVNGFSSPTGMSFSAWVKPARSSTAFKTGGWNYVARGYWTTVPFEFGHWGNGNLSLKAYNSAGTSFSISSGVNFSANSWYHVVATVDAATGAMRFYVNGNLVNSNTSYTGTLPGLNSLMIGGGTANCAYPGNIDEFRFYGRALSEDEVRLLYNQKKPFLEYDFDEGTGTVAHDESFNHRDGTITGAVWTAGESGGALSFNGTSAAVTATPTLGADEITVSFFMKEMGTTADWVEYANVSQDGSNRISMGSDDTNTRFLPIVRIGGVNYDAPNVAIPSGFNHYAAVFSKAGNFRKTYLNGVLVGTYTGWPGGFTIGSITLGSYSISVLDGFRIYDYARTDDEIAADYNLGLAAHFGAPGPDLDSGLAGYWDFEEGDGQYFYDKSGNGQTGMLGTDSGVDSLDASYGPGHDASEEVGTGLWCDGDRADVGTVDSLDMGLNDRTYALWFKNDGAFSSPNRTLIYSGANSASPATGGVWVAFSGTSSVLVHFADGSTTRVQQAFTTPIPVFDGKWHHLAVVYDRDYGAYVYVDGQRSTTSVLDITAQQASVNDANAQRPCGPSGYYFKGGLDEYRIYNRVLSADEVRMLYDQKKPVAQYDFEEGAGSTTNDASFNHVNGSLGGGTIGYMPAWVQGRYGGALSFDGTDDYVSTANSTALNLVGDYSIGLWVYNRAGAKTNPTLFNRDNQTGTDGYFWAYTGGTNEADVSFQYANGASAMTTTFSGALGMNVWTHLEFTFVDATKALTLYVNGQPFSTVRTLTGALPVDDGALYLGIYQGMTTNYSFYGFLDGFRLYSYARTASEVRTDYNAGMAAHLR